MQRFREFIKTKPIIFSLREEDAAPTTSTPVPTNPESGGGQKTNKYHFDKLQDELDIDDDAFKGAMEGGVQTLYKVPDYGWGFRVQPPVQASVRDKGTDQYEVTFLLNQASKRKMVLPYKQGQRPTYYEGPVENKTVMMNKEELADLMVSPYEAASGAGGAPPMGGGAPPMGGGAPPMGGGAPPMGGGAPPMGGGAPPMGGGAPPMGGI